MDSFTMEADGDACPSDFLFVSMMGMTPEQWEALGESDGGGSSDAEMIRHTRCSAMRFSQGRE
jgi:hypothetical protein